MVLARPSIILLLKQETLMEGGKAWECFLKCSWEEGPGLGLEESSVRMTGLWEEGQGIMIRGDK